jgi:histidinol-phosphate phosphatase family protein
MAYRRAALVRVGGFDERFPRAYREDADLALRTLAAGWRIVTGARTACHPVPPADRWVSVRRQRGNADDVLMDALHGRGWRERAGAPRGRRPRHLATTAAGLTAVGAMACGRGRLAVAATAIWLAGTAELAWARIAPGPRTPAEVATMLATSAAIPPAAALAWARGWLQRRRLLADEARAPRPVAAPAAVLFDRDGTLVVDVPYNGDPARVEPMPGARGALERLRAAGVPTAVVSNQSGVARGVLTMDQVAAVNRRLEELIGPLGPMMVCPHGPDEGCACRKPAPGLVLQAARALGVDPARCAVVGDIGADGEAGRAAGARAILVPTPRTRPEEVAAAPEVAADLDEAVERLLAGGMLA